MLACSTFSKPRVRVEVQNKPPWSVIAMIISFLFFREMPAKLSVPGYTPHLLNLDKRNENKVCLRAEKLFEESVAIL